VDFVYEHSDDHGIKGSGVYCGYSDARLDRSIVFYHETSGGKYVPRAVLFNLEPGVIGAVTPDAARQTLQPGKPREAYVRAKTDPVKCSGFCSCCKPRAHHRDTSLGPFVCEARAHSLRS